MTTTSTAGPVQDVVRRVGYDLVARDLTVTGVAELGPRLRRVTLGGEDLVGFAAQGPGDHVKVFFPDAEGGVPMPTVREGRWLDHGDPRFTYRDYTVRTFAPGDQALVLDMVVHTHGPAGRWAAQAAPGQHLGVLGPRGSMLPPLDRAHYLLAADETGLPALLNWLDRLPATARVDAVIEVDGAEDELPLHSTARLEVRWVHRAGRAAGTTELLPVAVNEALDRLGVPGSADALAGVTTTGPLDLWAWAAAETSAVRAIRGLLTSRGIGRDAFAMTGYWRRGVANFDHHSPDA